MQYSVVNYKTVKEDPIFRLDADFYRVDYLNYLQQVYKHEEYFLKKILHPTEIIRVYEERGIQILLAQNVRNNELDFSNVVFMSESAKENLKRNKLQYDDVILTRSGANFGQSASYKVDDEIYACADVLVIKNSKEIKGGYLSTFLNTKQGRALLDRGSYGMAQPHIAPSYLYNLPISRFDTNFENKIDTLVNESGKYKSNSSCLYSQAEQLLLSELELLDWKPKHELAFVKNFSDTKQSDRFDAEYFQPKYEEIISAVKKYKGGFDILENLSKLVGHPSNPPYETENTENKTFIITQKHLASYFPVDNFWKDEEALFTTDEFIEKNKKFILQENDLILYSVGAYIGKTNLYNADIKATIGSFLTLIRPKIDKINPFYLLVFLNSKIGQELTRRNSRGLAQQYIYPYDTKQVIIPILEINKQKEIEKIISGGQKSHNLSKSLLEIAKRGVEMAIEKDEQEGEKWIKNNLKELEKKI